MSFINIHDYKIGSRMLQDQRIAWIYSAYRVGCVKQSFIMPSICNSSGFAHGICEDRITDLSCMESICQPVTEQAGRVCVLLSITSCCCISSWLQRKSISCFFDAVINCMMTLLAALWVHPCPQKLFQYLREYFIWKLKGCYSQRITWDPYLWNPVAFFSCPCSQGKADRVTWGVLMLLAGFVGDAELMMPMLGFTGVCWDLFLHFMNPE